MTFESRYGRLDRLLHDLAFHGIVAQKALAEIEDRLYARRIAEIDAARPVFVTALPRAGTTLLLEVLGTQRDFAAHSYRQMPFLLCPLLWDRLSRGFRRTAELRERAHGDGLQVGYDSLEAFEEVLWRGVYSVHFADSVRWGVAWPTLWFALWHFAPGWVALGSRAWVLVAGAAVFGLTMSWVAYKTRSIRWTIASHFLAGVVQA